MVPSIVVVDYHKGNLSSVVRGLSRAGARAQASDSPEDIRAADAVVLPGVGSFYDAIAFMQESGEAQAVLDAIGKGTPFLGICLGLQILFETSEESPGAQGLGLLKGRIVRLPKESGLKIPHIGWNSLALKEGEPLPEGFRPVKRYVKFMWE